MSLPYFIEGGNMSNPIIDSINTIVNGGINSAPFDYTRNAGVVKNNDNGTCDIRLDNVNFTVPVYGYHKDITTGDVVKLIVPENNMNKAFILPKLYEPPTIPEISYENGKLIIGDIMIQWGYDNLTPTLGSSPRYYASKAITFPTPYVDTPCVWTCVAGGYSNIVNASYFSSSADGVSLFLTCSEKDVTRTVRWYAIGKFR